MSVVFVSTPNVYRNTGSSNLISDTPGIPWSPTGTTQVRVYNSGGRYGAKAFGFSAGASNESVYAVPTTPTTHFWLNWSQQRLINYSSNRYAHGLWVTVGSNIRLSIILANNGRAQLWINTSPTKTLLGESSSAYSISEWVDLRMRVNVLNGEIQAYANDDNFFSGFAAGYPGGNLVNLNMGPTFFPDSGSVIANGSQRWDDIILSYDGPDLGRTALLCLFPDADETAQDWTPASGSDGFAMIDEALASSLPPADYVEATTAGDISKYDIPAPSITVFGLYAVAIQSFQTKTSVATAETDLVLEVSGTDYNSPAQNLSDASYVLQEYIWDENPATTNQWLVTDIPNLRMGFEKVT